MASDFRYLLLSPENAPFDEFIFSIKFCEIFQGFTKKIPGLFQGFQGFPGLQRFSRVFQDFQGPYEPCLVQGSLVRTYGLKMLRVDTDFFKYGEKNFRFRKHPATRGWSNTIQKRYVWTQIFLRYGGKYLRFRKYPPYVWTRPNRNTGRIIPFKITFIGLMVCGKCHEA